MTEFYCCDKLKNLREEHYINPGHDAPDQVCFYNYDGQWKNHYFSYIKHCPFCGRKLSTL